MPSETGHARNVERFASLISFVQGYGAAYDPVNAAITVAALQSKMTAATAGIDGVMGSLSPWKVAVNSRQDAFEGIRKLTTRVVNSFAASGASKKAVEDAKGFKRKLDGARAGTLTADDPNTPGDESKNNSVSQQSYTQLVEHFDNLITMLDSDGNHNPNEVDLKLPALQSLSAQLKAANADVTSTVTPLSNSRISRDAELYADDSGLVDVAAMVKKYVKSVFGADSPQFAQISGLEFSRPR